MVAVGLSRDSRMVKDGKCSAADLLDSKTNLGAGVTATASDDEAAAGDMANLSKSSARSLSVGGSLSGSGGNLDIHFEPRETAAAWRHKEHIQTVDGRNPAPPGMYKTLQIVG